MSKFKVGDIVLFKSGCSIGDEARITGQDSEGHWEFVTITGTSKGHECYETNDVFDNALLIKRVKGEQTMGRRTFRLLKETDIWKKGILVQEMCDDGDQDFKPLPGQEDYMKFGLDDAEITREAVTDQPKFYEEVFPLVPEYGSKAEVEAFKKFAKGRK